MKRKWVFAAAFALGASAILMSVLSPFLPGIHLSAPLRGCLLLGGLLTLLGALDRTGAFPIYNYLQSQQEGDSAAIEQALVFLTVLIVIASYVFLVSLGRWTTWAPTTSYYDRLASALRTGHLYLDTKPDPALVALPNPYDPDARNGIAGLDASQPGSIWDMTLFGGRVYLYWGPAPALLVVAVKSLTAARIGDEHLTFGFLVGSFIFQSLIMIELRRRLFKDIPFWTVIVGMLIAGFVNPIPWVLLSPRIYEAAIAAGQFFFMGGLYFIIHAFTHNGPPVRSLAIASLLLVCAVASRATLAIAVAFLAVMVILRLWSVAADDPRHAGRLSHLAAFVLPLIMGSLLAGWYNLARFGSIFEFGFRYAITMLDQNKYHNVLFSLRYLGENAYLYFFNRPSFDAFFPFVKPVWNEAFIAQFSDHGQSIYNAERMIGLVYSAPFLLCGVLTFFLSRPVGGPNTTQALPAPMASPSRDPDTLQRWLALTLSGTAVFELLVIMLVYYGTMRYLLDATPTLVFLAIFGFWLGYRRLRAWHSWQAVYVIAVVVLVSITIVVSILVGFSSDVPRLKAANPMLLTHLKLFFISLTRKIHR